MALQWMVGAALGAGAIAYWLRMIYGHWRYRRRTQNMERLFREARADADGGSPYRLVTEQDIALLRDLRATDDARGALERLGFHLLGDLAIERPGRPPAGAARLLVDDAATSVAMVIVSREGHVLTRITSYADRGVFTTLLDRQPSLASPPSWVRQTVSGSFQDLVERHRSSITEPLHAVTSLEDAMREAADGYAQNRRWRAEQPPDELLDADLRGLLGKHYDRIGKKWARRLRDHLPEATLRRS